jgi:septal ring factor EnvC (AmiA/AmiB activator)
MGVMKLSRMGAFFVFLLFAVASTSGGCGKAPVCQTSLVTLDETRLDAETYEQEAAETAKNIADLEKKLADKKNDIVQIKDKPAELKAKVDVIKRGSGRE